MSNFKQDLETSKEVSFNVYFDGKVKSLGLQTEFGRATVGVMKKGTYQFSTSSIENITIISGILKVKIPGQGWTTYTKSDSLEVQAKVAFDLIAETDVAYICYYSE